MSNQKRFPMRTGLVGLVLASIVGSACGADLDISIEEDRPARTIVPAQVDAGLLELVRYDVEAAGLPGVAWSTVDAGGLVTSGAVGWGDVEEGVPASADMAYLWASVSKPVLSTVVMQLVDDGSLDLDADVNDYLDFDVHNPLVEGETITLRSLMTHRSGIIDGDAFEAAYSFEGDSQLGLEEFLVDYLVEGGELFDPLQNFAATRPGASFEYSNIGAGLVGLIVEMVVGEPLNEAAASSLFEPLGMDHTGWRLSDFNDDSTVATPYTADTGGFRPIGHVGHPTWPDGGLRASVNDIGRWLALVGSHDPAVVSSSSVQAMFDGGLFWELNGEFVQHTGLDHGAQSLVVLHRPTGISVALVTNSDQLAAAPVLAGLAEKLFSEHGLAFDADADTTDEGDSRNTQDLLDQAAAASPGGVAVAFAQGGEPVSTMSSGDGELASAVFPVPGATTTALAVVALQLLDEGSLGLNDSVVELLGENPLAARVAPEVRVVHLLSHTSGLAPHPANLGPDATTRQLLGAAELSVTRNEPGTVFEFSNTNNLLAEAVLETVTGIAVADLLQSRVLDPAGLGDSVLIEPDGITPVPGFLPGAADAPASTADLGDGMSHAGTVAFTVADLAVFQRVLAEGQLLATPAQVAQMRTPVTSDGYGLGMQDLGDSIGLPAFGLPGDTPGYRSVTVHLADGSIAVAIIANSEMVDVDVLAEELLS